MPAEIVFSGVGKTEAEMIRALEAGIGQFNLESAEEGLELAELAQRLGKTATCALRVNPDVDAGTHGKISTGKAENKFGVPFDRAADIFARCRPNPALPCVALRSTSAASFRALLRSKPRSPRSVG
jgi:diaminopimelate decarboxylase